MTAPTLNGISITGVDSLDVEKNGNIIPMPMPTGDSDETEVFDMLGVTKIISLSGKFTGSISSIKSTVDSVEALINGNQNTITFTSDQTGNISVMVMSIRTTWEVPGFKCNYDIKLVEGV